MFRILFFISLLFLTTTANIEAADIAQKKILGFSPDGHYFALEQYGVQDGFGFPYSEIFVIKTAGNNWAKTATPR